MKKSRKILSSLLAVVLTASAFGGLSISVNAAASATQQSLPYVNEFDDTTFVPSNANGVYYSTSHTCDTHSTPITGLGSLTAANGKLELTGSEASGTSCTGVHAVEFNFAPQSSGVLVAEFDYWVPGNAFYATEGLVLLENEDGSKVAGWMARGRGTITAVENGSFGTTSVRTGTWNQSNYQVKIEVDLDNRIWSATGTRLSVNNLPCNNANSVSKLKVVLMANGDAIDNLKIYKKVEATRGDAEVNLLTGQSSAPLGNFTMGTAAEAGMTFTSSNPSVATVNPTTGVVTAVGQGTCTVTATSHAFYGYNWTYTVNVRQGATSFTVDNLDLVLGIQGKNEKTLTYTTTPENSLLDTVAWTSNDTSVATVDTDGKVTAVAPGTTTIDASAFSGSLNASATVTVRNPSGITITSESSDPERVEVILGETAQLSATLADGVPTGALNWSVVSATPAGCATIDATGVVTPVVQGTATVQVEYLGATDTCTVQVIQPLTGLTINGAGNVHVLDLGETVALTAVKAPANADANTYKWRSGNHYVATVEGNGNTAVVKAVGKGTTQIYVSLANLHAIYTITVSGDAANISDSGVRTPSLISFAQVNGSFSDIGDVLWAQDAIQNVIENGYMTPDSDNFFGAKRNIKRDEFVSVVIKTLDLENIKASEPISKTFDDVDESNPYYAEIMKAVELGIITGINETSFAPNNDITRQDLAVIVMNALKAASVDTVVGRLDFNDAASIADYAQMAVRVLSKMNIMVGTNDGNFAPLANTTRAEVAVISEKITAIL